MLAISDLPDDAFGHWLAGFLDGEASFVIRPCTGQLNQRAFTTRMQLALRSDDAPLLTAIRDRTGLGSLYVGGPYGAHTPRANPQALWVVFSKIDCAALVVLLDRYPLLSKKARDYAVWRQAVEARAAKGLRGTAARRQDWSDVVVLKEQLELGRAYSPPAVHERVPS